VILAISPFGVVATITSVITAASALELDQDGRYPIACLLRTSIRGLPGITTGFAGVLDGQGCATGTITLPVGFPAGVRFFVSAVAVGPGAPGGLDTGNTLGLTSN
jgi:hypothetical protein